nr:thiamine pyrophosphate-dependent enzyme [Helicobacter saguini]
MHLEHFNVIESIESKNIDSINVVIDKLQKATRPIIFIGGGLKDSKEEIKEFIEKNKIPLVSSQSGCDIYGCGNELSIGVIGSIGGSRSGNFALQNADFILAIGTRLSTQSIGDTKTFAREAELIVVDIDEFEHKKNDLKISLEINIDSKEFLNYLNKQTLNLNIDSWIEKCKHYKKIFAIENENFIKDLNEDSKLDLYYLASKLSKLIESNTTIITDAGLEQLILPSTIRFKDSITCLFPAAQGAMGYAIPAILGAHFASDSARQKNIITIVGDGSIMMNIQELQTITFHNIKAKIIVINNNMFAVIRNRQKDLFRNRTIGNDSSDGLPNPNFEKIASSFDFKYLKARNIKEFESSIKAFLDSKEAVIFEIYCNENQQYLHTSFGFNAKKRLVKKPLEDLSPFINRDLFLQEMIVKPLD